MSDFFNSGQVRFTGFETLTDGVSERAFRRDDQLTVVTSISVSQALVDADARFDLFIHLVDPLGVFNRSHHWAWGILQPFQWGPNFWTSLSFDRVGDLDIGRGRARAFKASIYLNGLDEFAVSADHYVYLRYD